MIADTQLPLPAGGCAGAHAAVARNDVIITRFLTATATR